MHTLTSETISVEGLGDVVKRLNKTVADGDGMYSGDDRYYLETGANALQIIYRSLAAAGKSVSSPRSILDYGCGYGRILRWLRAAYPEAELVGADIDKKALAAVGRLFGVKTVKLGRSRSKTLKSFDLIWVGSVMTHLPKDAAMAHLGRFKKLLSLGGLLVFTTHGPYVTERIKHRDKVYGLDEPGIAALLAGYADCGFGFGPYPKHGAYGISACTPPAALALVTSAGLEPLLYQARGWVRHQDVIAAINAPS
jgi:SAM-dependent methyltransferase